MPASMLSMLGLQAAYTGAYGKAVAYCGACSLSAASAIGWSASASFTRMSSSSSSSVIRLDCPAPSRLPRFSRCASLPLLKALPLACLLLVKRGLLSRPLPSCPLRFWLSLLPLEAGCELLLLLPGALCPLPEG